MMRKRVDRFYTLVIGKIVMAVGAVMVLAIAVQIATRYIPGFSITWTDELARLMFVWYGFLGAALAVPKGVHLGIDYFYRKSRGWLRKCFDGVVVTCMLIFSGTVLYSGATCSRWCPGRIPPCWAFPSRIFMERYRYAPC